MRTLLLVLIAACSPGSPTSQQAGEDASPTPLPPAESKLRSAPLDPAESKLRSAPLDPLWAWSHEESRHGDLAWVRAIPISDTTCFASFDFVEGGPPYVHGGQVFRTDDGGASWRPLGSFAGELIQVHGGPSGSIFMHRATLIAGYSHQLYVADDGETWKYVNHEEASGAWYSEVLQDADDQDVGWWGHPGDSAWCRADGRSVVAGEYRLVPANLPDGVVSLMLPDHTEERPALTKVHTAEDGEHCLLSFETRDPERSHVYQTSRSHPTSVNFIGTYPGSLVAVRFEDHAGAMVRELADGSKKVFVTARGRWTWEEADLASSEGTFWEPLLKQAKQTAGWCTATESGARLDGMSQETEVFLNPAQSEDP